MIAIIQMASCVYVIAFEVSFGRNYNLHSVVRLFLESTHLQGMNFVSRKGNKRGKQSLYYLVIYPAVIQLGCHAKA